MRRKSMSSLAAGMWAAGALALLACGPDAAPAPAPQFAKAPPSTNLTVTAASPDSAGRDTTLSIAVAGTGFDNGSTVQFARGGIVDPKLHVNGVAFVSGSKLNANVTIAVDAALGSYDVAVTTSTGKKGVGSELFAVVMTNATATWTIPLADAGLALRSDHKSSDGTNSVYANGVCTVSGTLYAGGTGDVTIQTSVTKGKSCGRAFTLLYPDGVTETVAAFANLASLEGAGSTIPVGSTVRRHMNFAPGSPNGSPGSNQSRCGGLYFGVGRLGNGVGSDSLLVTRVDGRTWHVYSDLAVYADGVHDRVLCGSTNTLYAMPVDFTVISSKTEP